MLRVLSTMVLVVGLGLSTVSFASQCDDIKSLEYGARVLRLPGPQYRLAHCYMDGDGVERNDEKAAALMRLAATTGMTDAMYELSKLLRAGRGLEKDDVEACALLLLAIDSGRISAPDEEIDESLNYAASLPRAKRNACEMMTDYIRQDIADALKALDARVKKSPKLYEEYAR